jgi:hypothetical protein
MSKYDYIKNLKAEDFRRLTGVQRETFDLMLLKLQEAQQNKKKQTGKHFIKLSIEDKLLLELEYLRENRTFYHIAGSYGVNETTALRASHWVEDVLSKCKEFKLPSKRRVLGSDMEYEVFVIDATETPIERPTTKKKNKSNKNSKEENKSKKNTKKAESVDLVNKNITIQERKKDIPLKHR